MIRFLAVLALCAGFATACSHRSDACKGPDCSKAKAEKCCATSETGKCCPKPETAPPATTK
jgi:hypothetical protein